MYLVYGYNYGMEGESRSDQRVVGSIENAHAWMDRVIQRTVHGAHVHGFRVEKLQMDRGPVLVESWIAMEDPCTSMADFKMYDVSSIKVIAVPHG